MIARLEQEIACLRKVHRDVEGDPDHRWVIVRSLPLPEGWNRSRTDILVLIPSGYPTTAPDNFYADASLRLANGARPNRAPQEKSIAGCGWLMFSWHVESGDWRPHADPEKGHNLVTYMEGVRMRLSDPS